MKHHYTDIVDRIKSKGNEILPKGGQLWLYGSRARGDYRADSDWDLLVLIDKSQQQWQDFDNYVNPFIELGFEMGVAINPMLYTQKEWKEMNFTPFYHNVQNDKIEIL